MTSARGHSEARRASALVRPAPIGVLLAEAETGRTTQTARGAQKSKQGGIALRTLHPDVQYSVIQGRAGPQHFDLSRSLTECDEWKLCGELEAVVRRAVVSPTEEMPQDQADMIGAMSQLRCS